MYVEGEHKDGDAVVRNTPVLIGGVDGSSNVQTLLVGTDGSLNVNATGAPTSLGQKAMAASTSVAIASDQSTVPTNVAQINGVTPLMGAGNTGTGSPRVTIATNQAAIPVTTSPAAASTATLANVAGSASSVTLQAANAARLGLAIVNESTAILYVKFGSTASATSYTIALGPMGAVGSYYEVPFGYNGIVTGIWASATGSARVTEITA